MRRTVARGIELARVALLFGAARGLIRLSGIIPAVTGRATRDAFRLQPNCTQSGGAHVHRYFLRRPYMRSEDTDPWLPRLSYRKGKP